MFELKDKIALVTGGRRGMGRTHALALAKQGAKVAITDMDVNECAPVVQEIKVQGGEAVCYKMDVLSKAEVEKVFDEVIKQFGRLDILVNNAGIYFPKPALELTEEDWDKMIGTNLRGQFFCAQRAAKEKA
ncbi:MAG: SDR family NAD(P)-dependent oxidoreductase, partial [Patescibacteria group bacterium]